jgi:hypothetical protein
MLMDRGREPEMSVECFAFHTSICPSSNEVEGTGPETVAGPPLERKVAIFLFLFFFKLNLI